MGWSFLMIVVSSVLIGACIHLVVTEARKAFFVYAVWF